jgi:hypothetical protein
MILSSIIHHCQNPLEFISTPASYLGGSSTQVINPEVGRLYEVVADLLSASRQILIKLFNVGHESFPATPFPILLSVVIV